IRKESCQRCPCRINFPLRNLLNRGCQTRIASRWNSGESLMVIPCIDLMDGTIVQLVKGEQKALELDSPDEALEMFKDFPLLHIIDLDAAKSRGNNQDLIKYLIGKTTARVGGGVRTVEDAKRMLELGAAQVIVGTSAFL